MNDNPKVFVGTFKKYNEEGAVGEWLDLTDYVDHEEFIDACKELHKDEEDPELMFSDYECFPDAFYDECSIHEDLWKWMELTDTEREVYAAYVNNCGTNNFDSDWRLAQEAYQGEFETMKEFAYFLVDEGVFGDVPKIIEHYIDYVAIARDLVMDYWIEDGKVFRNI